jgi:hypothetical protein
MVIGVFETNDEMLSYIRAHVRERGDETYKLFPKIDETILDELSEKNIPWTGIHTQMNIYIAKMSGNIHELLDIFHKHGLYVPFKFKYKQFLKLAIFFIQQDFEISDLSFHDNEYEINSRNELELFDVKKDDVWMTFWHDGTIDSNVEPTNYLRSFYTLYYKEVGVNENDSHSKNLQRT